MRLEITCKDYQEKLLASEAIMTNYKAIQEENRRLYNQVQDLRGNIRVFCR
jgi:Microtubule binding